MIGWVEGRLAEKTPESVLVDVNGVGYDVRIPISTFLELPDEGKTVRIRIHTHVREDQLQLFGFLSEEERSCFRLLLGISGVGPRLALAVLSGLPVSQLVLALREGNLTALRGIPGVGNKTAERILMELRDKVGRLEDVALDHRQALHDVADQVRVRGGVEEHYSGLAGLVQEIACQVRAEEAGASGDHDGQDGVLLPRMRTSATIIRGHPRCQTAIARRLTSPTAMGTIAVLVEEAGRST